MFEKMLFDKKDGSKHTKNILKSTTLKNMRKHTKDSNFLDQETKKVEFFGWYVLV